LLVVLASLSSTLKFVDVVRRRLGGLGAPGATIAPGDTSGSNWEIELPLVDEGDVDEDGLRSEDASFSRCALSVQAVCPVVLDVLDVELILDAAARRGYSNLSCSSEVKEREDRLR
jgi:hypothetical protein